MYCTIRTKTGQDSREWMDRRIREYQGWKFEHIHFYKLANMPVRYARDY
jgi:hypothetical protein